jgi:hypothetical protein
MHTLEESRRLCEALPCGRFLDLGSNDAAHGQPLVDAIEAFVKETAPRRNATCGETREKLPG